MSDTPVGFDQKTIPAEIDRWNWGAFLLNWIWGIGNHTYIALLTLHSVFGFIWLFVLGAKGSAWAWRNGRWDSVDISSACNAAGRYRAPLSGSPCWCCSAASSAACFTD